MGLPDAVLTLLIDQCSVVTRPQLLDAGGLKPSQVDALIRRGHITRYHHGTYRRTGAAPTPHQEAMAAVLRCRPRARLTGPRILGFLGIEESEATDAFSVLVPPGRRVQNVPFDVRDDLAVGWGEASYEGVPGTTPALTLFELARATGWTDDALLKLFDRLRWARVLTRERLEHACRELTDHPGATRMAALLGQPAGEVESPGERDALPVLLQLEPAPEFQVWVAPDIRVDALWRPHNLVIEYGGAATHEDDRDRAADAARDARLRQLGFEVLHVTAADLRHPDALLARIRRAAGVA